MGIKKHVLLQVLLIPKVMSRTMYYQKNERGLFWCLWGGQPKKQIKRPLAPILWIVHCSRHDFWNQQNLYILFYTHLGIFLTNIFLPY